MVRTYAPSDAVEFGCGRLRRVRSFAEVTRSDQATQSGSNDEQRAPKTSRDFNYKLAVSGGCAGLLYVAVGVLVWLTADNQASRVTTAVPALLGISVGWLFGILSAPYGEEKSRFGGYAKLLGSFVSGFLVSKVDRLFELAISEGSFADTLFMVRVAIFLTCVILTMVTVYVFRTYG